MSKLSIVFITSLLSIFFLETVLTKIKPTPYEKDEILGWKLKKNFHYKFENYTFSNKKYYSIYETNENGLIEYKTKTNYDKDLNILIIGDSFSTDPLSSNNKFWYSVMADELSDLKKKNIKTLASGGGGYGTIQQYLISKNLKNLKPDIFILQFCINDFINNSLEWEKQIFFFSQYFWRPYYDDKKNEYYYHQSTLKSFLKPIKDSRLVSVMLSRSGIVAEKFFSKEKHYIEDEIFSNSINITKKFLKKIYDNFPLSKKIIINCKPAKTYPDTEWITIAKEIGYIILTDGNLKISESILEERDIFNKDGGHYNDLGNYIFGKAVAKELNKKLHLN